VKSTIIEVTNGFNWGKFLVARFDADEWEYRSQIDKMSNSTGILPIRLLRSLGWGPDHFLFLDLQTGEGAMFRVGGLARADLNKHCVWVCPMAEPALAWLLRQDLSDLDALPALVELTEAEAPSAMHGYRRPGEQEPFVEFV
jgi:hypothetical protein